MLVLYYKFVQYNFLNPSQTVFPFSLLLFYYFMRGNKTSPCPSLRFLLELSSRTMKSCSYLIELKERTI